MAPAASDGPVDVRPQPAPPSGLQANSTPIERHAALLAQAAATAALQSAAAAASADGVPPGARARMRAAVRALLVVAAQMVVPARLDRDKVRPPVYGMMGETALQHVTVPRAAAKGPAPGPELHLRGFSQEAAVFTPPQLLQDNAAVLARAMYEDEVGGAAPKQQGAEAGAGGAPPRPGAPRALLRLRLVPRVELLTVGTQQQQQRPAASPGPGGGLSAGAGDGLAGATSRVLRIHFDGPGSEAVLKLWGCGGAVDEEYFLSLPAVELPDPFGLGALSAEPGAAAADPAARAPALVGRARVVCPATGMRAELYFGAGLAAASGGVGHGSGALSQPGSPTARGGGGASSPGAAGPGGGGGGRKRISFRDATGGFLPDAAGLQQLQEDHAAAAAAAAAATTAAGTLLPLAAAGRSSSRPSSAGAGTTPADLGRPPLRPSLDRPRRPSLGLSAPERPVTPTILLHAPVGEPPADAASPPADAAVLPPGPAAASLAVVKLASSPSLRSSVYGKLYGANVITRAAALADEGSAPPAAWRPLAEFDGAWDGSVVENDLPGGGEPHAPLPAAGAVLFARADWFPTWQPGSNNQPAVPAAEGLRDPGVMEARRLWYALADATRRAPGLAACPASDVARRIVLAATRGDSALAALAHRRALVAACDHVSEEFKSDVANNGPHTNNVPMMYGLDVILVQA